MRNLRLSCALAALSVASTGALAQSTGSREFDEIVVTASTKTQTLGGVALPDTPKTREVLNSQFIQVQTPGQSIDDIINQLPGVSFQNNDPYGSAGGTLNIRGFDGSRISQTFDGIPLNDTGNYAIYSNQQLDSELIDHVTVSLGSTDIDSPTASASGSTVNYTTIAPTDDFHARVDASLGEFDYKRIFALLDTGTFGPWGTSAWFAASHSQNDVPFNHFGHINKDQYNIKVNQPIGSNGDFVSVAGHYNNNRNNFFGSVPLRVDLTQSPINLAPRVVGTGSNNRFPRNSDERTYPVPLCQLSAARPGVADAANTCGTSYDERFNPSNTANIRVNSRFTLTDKLILTVDPFYEYTKANGGGTVTASEGLATVGGSKIPGFIGTSATGTTQQAYAGHDLNGDGDVLDTVTLLAPSNTITHRYGVIANLRYDFSPTQTVRINYTLDYGRHRQTGETGFLNVDGSPASVFPINDPIQDSLGFPLEKRDRLSKAILNQVSAEYRGKFLDERLTFTAGVRAPFFQRKLNNFCFTRSAAGGVTCFGQNDASNAVYAAANPTFQPPQQRDRKYDKLLPSAGAIFDLGGGAGLYASYARGLQVPGTDNLYNAFFFPNSDPASRPKPETTDNIDGGIRYKHGGIQAQLAGWYTRFSNRLASSFDPVENVTVYRNLGTVRKYGVDFDVSYQPIEHFTVRAFGSYLKSKIIDDVQSGFCTVATPLAPPLSGNCVVGQPIFALTAGERESGSPTYLFGGRAQGNLGPVDLGLQFKRTGPRYINDQNTPVYQSYVASGVTNFYQVYGRRTPSYNIVDLDARLHLTAFGSSDRTYIQVNVTNLFNKFYVGGFGGTTANNSVSFVQIGAPRAISGTLVVGF